MRWKTLAAALGLLGVLILSACGTTTTNALGGGAPAATATSTTGSSGSSALISTHTANVKGTSETVLSTGQGMTLYYRTDDTSTTVHCTSGGGYGGCTDIWPPLLSPNGAAPTSDTTLPGGLSLLNDSNGQQVMYNGHPLYTYSGDHAPGDATGEGVQGVWHVVTPSLAANGAAPSGNPTPTSTGGGYGGGYP